MIHLTCMTCRATLEIDDGFAGGACRCRHCGTIQTVPTHLKNNPQKPKQVGRTLYRQPAEAPPLSGTGLEQLADVVVSSGLTSDRLRKPAKSDGQRKRAKLILIAGIILVFVLGGLMIFFMTRDRGAAPTLTATVTAATGIPQNAAQQTTLAAAPKASPVAEKPNFCGLPLDGTSVIYVLDRGDSTREIFGSLRAVTLRSIASLGSDRKFQIIFWNNGSDDAYPSGRPVFATPENIAAAGRATEEIAPHGKTDISSALTKAISAAPSAIVIATGKAWDLDDSFVATVERIRNNAPVRIHTVALGDPGSSTALQTVAGKSKGEFKAVTEAELREAAKEE